MLEKRLSRIAYDFEAMHKPHTRVVELDILRAFAIIIIVFSHAGYFLPAIKIPYYSQLSLCGVALFLFISGFVLHLNHPDFSQRDSLTDFFKRRVLRIFPLYWLAIAVSFATGDVVIGSPVTSQSALITILGLQGFLSPRFGTDLMNYWSFIGIIIVLYTLYPLIAVLASDTLNLPRPFASNLFRFAIMLIVPFTILVAAHNALFIIADAVFSFYGIFVLGVATSKYNIFHKYGFQTNDQTRLLKYIVVGGIALTFVLFVYTRELRLANVSATLYFLNYSLFVTKNLVFFLFALVAFCLARILVISSCKASRRSYQPIWYRGLLLISFSSYAIYLFFLPILTQSMKTLTSAQLASFEVTIFQVFIGLPTVILLAYVLQSTQNEILNRIRKYRASTVPSSDKT